MKILKRTTTEIPVVLNLVKEKVDGNILYLTAKKNLDELMRAISTCIESNNRLIIINMTEVDIVDNDFVIQLVAKGSLPNVTICYYGVSSKVLNYLRDNGYANCFAMHSSLADALKSFPE